MEKRFLKGLNFKEKEVKKMKKLLLLFIVLSMGTLLLASTAYPFAVKFETIDYFAWGRTYDPLTGVPQNLNPYDSSSTQTLLPGTYKLPDGTEDAFGITQIQKISNPAGTITYWEKSASQELTVFFHGADDVYLGAKDPITLQSALLSDGFTVEMWLDTPPDYNPTLGTGGRTGVSTYTTVSGAGEGIMVLKLQGHTQYLDYWAGTKNQPYTLQETGYPDSGQFDGAILFDVVGGTWASFYDTNTIVPGRDSMNADFNFSFSTTTSPGVADWLVGDTSNAFGDVVPEPATMVLFGSGLIGLAGWGRRKIGKNTKKD